MKLQNINFKVTLIACICLFLFGVLFGFIAFPKILKMGIAKVLNLWMIDRGFLKLFSLNICCSELRANSEDPIARNVADSAIRFGFPRIPFQCDKSRWSDEGWKTARSTSGTIFLRVSENNFSCEILGFLNFRLLFSAQRIQEESESDRGRGRGHNYIQCRGHILLQSREISWTYRRGSDYFS